MINFKVGDAVNHIFNARLCGVIVKTPITGYNTALTSYVVRWADGNISDHLCSFLRSADDPNLIMKELLNK